MTDTITISRVANGWIIQPSGHDLASEFTHVAVTPDEVIGPVEKWVLASVPSVRNAAMTANNGGHGGVGTPRQFAVMEAKS